MRFASQDTKRLDLPDDQDGTKNWIEVRKYLTAGEDRMYRTAGLRKVVPGKPGDQAATAVDVDWQAMSFARALAYIVRWSDRRPFTADALRALDPVDFERMDEAIVVHIEEMDQEKKVASGLTTSTSA